MSDTAPRPRSSDAHDAGGGPWPEAVCFDLDSTLCEANQSAEDVHRVVFERAGVEPLFTVHDVWAVDPTEVGHAATRAGFFANLYRAAIGEPSPGADPDPALLDELGEHTADVLDPADVSFRPGARAALDHARERYAVGLVTNGGERTQTAKLEALGIADAFDVTVFCDPADGRPLKPSTDPFERALAALGSSPGRTVHVGDSHGMDVVGAHAAGLQSVWVPAERPGAEAPADPDPLPTYRLDSLADLASVL